MQQTLVQSSVTKSLARCNDTNKELHATMQQTLVQSSVTRCNDTDRELIQQTRGAKNLSHVAMTPIENSTQPCNKHSCKDLSHPRELSYSLKTHPRELSYSGTLYRDTRENPQTIYRDTRENSRENSRTCLLYTSPSPRDISLSRMPSSA